MQKTRYRPLINNDDDQEVNDYNLVQNRLLCHIQECTITRWLKILLIFFLLIKGIYVIKVFKRESENDVNFIKVNNFIENTTILYTETSLEALKDVSHTTLSKDQIGIDISLARTHNDNKTKIENKYDRDNDHGNSELKTVRLILGSGGEEITTITTNLSVNKINKTTINKSTIEAIATTTTTTAATTATTTNVKTSSLIKPPAITHSSWSDKQIYFLNTSHCRIPFVEPFTPEIRKIFKPLHSTGCTKDEPIITVSFNEVEAHYILHINYTVAATLKKSNENTNSIKADILCCYQQIVRSGSGSNVDSSFKLLPCTNFHPDFVVPNHMNGIIVKCKSKAKKSILQEDAFSFVQVNKSLMQQMSTTAATKRRKLSVLMIGIDTLSRINFRRNMPEMFKYLVHNKWYELMGYNKVGDNTLPNLMPLLSGYTRQTVYDKCHPGKVGGFDNCNFIWTAFKKKGYHTAYAEDLSFITTFNYHLKGFKESPTDYYFRPMALAIEKSMKKKLKAGLSYCLGRKQFGEYIYDYATDFAARFKNSSSFGLFWTNSFSHNSFDVAATMDNLMVKYFREWERRGVFENSVVIFFSDHGTRWGPLLKLSQGFLEQRLPMFFISVPNWFRKLYPQLVKNLEINQKRLSNPFDIHMTLQHLLELSEPTYKAQIALDCPKCQSIFKEIPENRTCDDANIPNAWCTCLPLRTESTKSATVQTVAKLIVQEINNYYELRNLTSLCRPLQLKEITIAKQFYPDESQSSRHNNTYVIDFVTEPKALFSATANYDEHKKRVQLNVEDISRQSLYESTAKCIADKEAKKYCICKNSS